MISGPTNLQQTPRPNITFGLGGAIPWAMNQILSSRSTELLVSDVGGMVLPRTGIEYHKRGNDMARETLLRELAGTVSNVYLIGWMGAFFLSLFYGRTMSSRLLRVNKQGLDFRSWINSTNLEVYANTFQQALKKGKSPKEARQIFIKSILASLKPSDREQARFQKAELLERLAGSSNKARRALNKSLKHIDDGSLSAKAITKLAKQFEKGTGVAAITKEVNRYEQQLLKQRSIQDTIEKTLAKAHDLRGLSPKQAKAEATRRVLAPYLREKRLNLSKESRQVRTLSMPHTLETFMKKGLAEKVDFVAKDGTVTLHDRNLKTTLNEVKTFLEQYVDRVLDDTKTRAFNQKHGWAHARQKAEADLFTEAPKAFFKRLFPSAKDGLIRYTQRTRVFMTAIPLLISCVLGIGFAFFNNWLTSRKYDGKVFFPGAEALKADLLEESGADAQASPAFKGSFA